MLHRHPSTQQERREAAQAEVDSYESEMIPPPRAKRNARNLPNAWDDKSPGRRGNGWKIRRRNRWRD